jgi:hypothetical protein
MLIAQECGERRVEATLYRLLGDIAADREVPSHEMAADYRRSLALPTEIGARPLVAEVHLRLAKL